MKVFLGFLVKAIDRIVFMWITRITNLGWVHQFFQHLDKQPRRESESGSLNIHTVRF